MDKNTAQTEQRALETVLRERGSSRHFQESQLGQGVKAAQIPAASLRSAPLHI
jgi:hypothetical protein